MEGCCCCSSSSSSSYVIVVFVDGAVTVEGGDGDSSTICGEGNELLWVTGAP